jgi:hypothetical protein
VLAFILLRLSVETKTVQGARVLPLHRADRGRGRLFVLIAASLSYYVIEKPFLTLKERWGPALALCKLTKTG